MLTHRFGLTLLASCVLLIGCGGSGGGDNPAAAPVATQLELLAGHIGGAGNIDGVGSAARFNSPQAAVRAPSGEVYVADTDNHLIRRINTDGKVSVWAGHLVPQVGYNSGGFADGNRLTAQFSFPSDIAIGSDGTLYVADRGNAVIRAISPAGIVRTLAGQVSQPGSTDGLGANAQFAYPASLLMESSGTLLVMERDGGLRTINPQGEVGTVLTTLPQGLRLTGAGLDKAGRRLVSGRFSYTSGAALYRLDGNGNATLLAGDPWVSGTTDGDSASARFGTIASVVEDANGNLLIADAYSYLSAGVRAVQTGGTTIRKLSVNGIVSTIAGRGLTSGNVDGDSASNLLCDPVSIKPYDGTTWLVADKCNYSIRVLGSDGQLTTPWGQASATGDVNANGDRARFSSPNGITASQDSNTYVADSGNSSIRRISASGQTTIFATVPNGLAPGSLATDGSASWCFSETVRGLSYPAPSVSISCAAADGSVRKLHPGVKDGVRYFDSVWGLASDHQGRWLISDGTSSALRSISADGTVTTLAKDLIARPGALVTAGDGTVYFQSGNSIQKRQNDGSLTLVAGAPDIAGAQDGSAATARFGTISALALDAQNYLYVADAYTSPTIRLISPSGKVSTLAGTPGLTGVRLGSAPGSLATIRGLAVSADQKSLLATTANGVIRITLQR